VSVFAQPALRAGEGCLRDGYFSPHRTHSNRLISIPAAAADAGLNASLASTSAQTSPRCVARASAKSNTLVLPDEAVPQISVRQPRARPPVSKSSCGMPLETISGAGRTSRREAGTTAASLGMAPMWAKISAVFFAVFAAVERGGENRGEKIKERPMAADEKTGEADILSRFYCHSQLSGTQRARSARARSCTFRFLFAYVSIALRAAVVKAVRLKAAVRIMSQDCNLKIHNALRRNFASKIGCGRFPGLENRETWGTRFGENELLL
jgi:hypothetical protein